MQLRSSFLRESSGNEFGGTGRKYPKTLRGILERIGIPRAERDNVIQGQDNSSLEVCIK